MLLPALLLGVLALWGLSNMFKGRPQVPEVNGYNPTMRQGPGVQERQGPPAEPAPAGGTAPAAPAVNTPQMAAPEVAHPESTLPDTKFNFEVASTKLARGSEGSVDELAQFLKSNPDSVIHVEGFADSTGDTQANETLSENRAAAIKNALVAKGIDASRDRDLGHGREQPGRAQRQRPGSRPESARRGDAGALREAITHLGSPSQETPEKRRT